MDLLQQFREYIKTNDLFKEKDRLLLAVSGGVDSVVLAALCKDAGFDFEIAHCNFQLRGEESDRDEKFVNELATKLGVPCHSKTFDTRSVAKELKKGIEETARDLRYDWFHKLLNEHGLEYLLTAHHADDSIETMSMNFFRGTGIKGLRGIQPKNGRIIRPLLFARRQELEDFVAQHKLQYVTDNTNYDEGYTRNFFRNRLIPLFKNAYPSVEQNLLHNLERFSGAEELYEQAIAFHKKKLLEEKGDEVHIPLLKLKKSAPLRTIIYEIISDYNFTANQTDDVLRLLDSDSGKYISSATHRIIKNRAWLIITPVEETRSENILIETGNGEFTTAVGKLRIKTTSTPNTKPQTSNQIACLDGSNIEFPLLLRKWKQGDYFYPLGMKKKKKVARFLIDNKISKSDKEKVWVIESNQRIVWLVNFRIDDRFKVTDKTTSILELSIHS